MATLRSTCALLLALASTVFSVFVDDGTLEPTGERLLSLEGATAAPGAPIEGNTAEALRDAIEAMKKAVSVASGEGQEFAKEEEDQEEESNVKEGVASGDGAKCATLINLGTHLTIPVGVGTPPQWFDMVADTGSGYVIVPDCLCRESKSCNIQDRCYTGKSKSTSFMMASTPPEKKHKRGHHGDQVPIAEVAFGSGVVQAVVAQDIVSTAGVKGFCNNSLMLMVRAKLMIDGPFEGILGLGIPQSSAEAKKEEASDEPLLGQEANMQIHKSIGPGGVIGKSNTQNSALVQFKPPTFNEEREDDQFQIGKSFMEQAGVERFSLCIADGADGVLRINPAAEPKSLGSLGKMHWGVNLEGVAVGEDKPSNIVFCSAENKKAGQITACGAIPDSGTTVMTGPAKQVKALIEKLCDQWDRCARKYEEKLAAASQRNARGSRPRIIVGGGGRFTEGRSKQRPLMQALQKHRPNLAGMAQGDGLTDPSMAAGLDDGTIAVQDLEAEPSIPSPSDEGGGLGSGMVIAGPSNAPQQIVFPFSEGGMAEAIKQIQKLGKMGVTIQGESGSDGASEGPGVDIQKIYGSNGDPAITGTDSDEDGLGSDAYPMERLKNHFANEVEKDEVFKELVASCRKWMTEDKGLDELPSIFFRIAGTEGNNQSLEFKGSGYVIEMLDDEVETRHTSMNGVPGIAQRPTGKQEKVCSPAFGVMDYVTKDSGPVWILGTPLFYEFTVVYDVASTPPSMSFTKKDCGTCDKKSGGASLVETSERVSTKGRPRFVKGPLRLPVFNFSRGF